MSNPLLLLPALVAMFSVATCSLWSATQVGSAPYAASVTGAGNSYAPVFSADGSHVAFVSHANNLVTNDDRGPHLDLFVRDLAASNTVLVSVSTNGFGGANDNIGLYTLSSNAQFIAFDTDANNLAAGDTNHWSDIYVWDRAGTAIWLITVGGNGASISPLITEDGRYVLFSSMASNLVPDDVNGTNDVFIHDLMTGVTTFWTTNLPRVVYGGAVPATALGGLLEAWDTADGTIVPNDFNNASDVFVRNTMTGETQLVSVRETSLPDRTSRSSSRLELNPRSLSADGKKLALLSFDGNQAPDDTNRLRDIFVRNLKDGTTVNVSMFPRDANIFSYVDIGSSPSLSADGRYLLFLGDRPAGFGASNGRKLFWRDLHAPTNRSLLPVSASPSIPLAPSLDGSGRLVAFVAGSAVDPNYPDNNGTTDVFVQLVTPHPEIRDCIPGVTSAPPLFVSEAWRESTTANGPSTNANISPDSGLVLFESRANNLLETAIPPQTAYQLYARPLWITNRSDDPCLLGVDVLAYGSTRLISYATSATSNGDGVVNHIPLAGGGFNPKFSGDSRYVAFESAPSSIYRHDLSAGWIEEVSNVDGVAMTNRSRPTNLLVCTGCANASLNLDGRYAAYESRPGPGGVTNIYLKNLSSGSVELVSVSLIGTNGNGSSFSPLLSHDARFVVFASRASDLVPGDNNRAMDVFLRDRVNGVTHCLSRNWSGTGTGNRVSSNPIMSADGRTVAFQSFASDLVPGDYNDTRDVFVVTLAGPDNDGDGMEDDWEIAYFNTLDRDGSGDFDSDGAGDLAEFRAGTNPANDASILRVISIASALSAPPPLNHHRTTVLWSASPGKTYRVQFKENVDAPWTDLPGEITASGTSASATHSAFTTTPRGFYRVLLVQ